MTDQMHDGKWAACQERDNSRERARQSCIQSQFTPSPLFLRLVFFFALLLAVARAAVPQPFFLLNYHPHTDKQAADGKRYSVHEEIQFRHGNNVLYQGGWLTVQEDRVKIQPWHLGAETQCLYTAKGWSAINDVCLGGCLSMLVLFLKRDVLSF